MSLAEIKAELPKLSIAEQIELRACLNLLMDRSSPEYLRELERRLAEIENGRKYSAEDIRRLDLETDRSK